MINFFGMIDCVSSWTWVEAPGTIRAKGGVVFELKALPLLLTEDNEVWDLGQGDPGDAVCFRVFHGARQERPAVPRLS